MQDATHKENSIARSRVFPLPGFAGPWLRQRSGATLPGSARSATDWRGGGPKNADSYTLHLPRTSGPRPWLCGKTYESAAGNRRSHPALRGPSARTAIMDRRHFLTTSSSLTAISALAACGPPGASPTGAKAIRKPLKMHVGTQRPSTNPEMLQFFKRHGVDHCCGWPPVKEGEPRRDWELDEIAQQKELCARHGLSMDMIGVPFMTPPHIDRNPRGPAYSSARIRPATGRSSTSGISSSPAPGPKCPASSTTCAFWGPCAPERTHGGRGGSSYSTWKLSDARQEPPSDPGGTGARRGLLGADRLLPGAGDPGVQRIPGPAPPAIPTTRGSHPRAFRAWTGSWGLPKD